MSHVTNHKNKPDFNKLYLGNMSENIFYSSKCIDFVVLSSEYCKYLEQTEETDRNTFNDVVRGLLTVIYLRATLLPDFDEPEGYNDPCVTEDDYNYIRNKAARTMKDLDDYLDVFVQEFKYNDQPILCTISEGLADLYQVLRELTEAYKNEYEEAIHAQIYDVKESFQNEWGQKLLNTLKALHDARFNNTND